MPVLDVVLHVLLHRMSTICDHRGSPSRPTRFQALELYGLGTRKAK